MSTITHVRQHNSILAAADLAFVLAASDPVAGVSLVVLCLVLNWFGDSLDGTLARVFPLLA